MRLIGISLEDSSMNSDSKKESWKTLSDDEYAWEDENEERLWYCPHGKAYAIRCKPCEDDDE
jgi:hypothetical protein